MKELLKKKEIREKTLKQTKQHDEVRSSVAVEIATLPKNFVVVMTYAMLLADKKEKELSGVYEIVFNEVLRHNGIPEIKIPRPYITNYEGRPGTRDAEQEEMEEEEEEEDEEGKKRKRTSDSATEEHTADTEDVRRDLDSDEASIARDRPLSERFYICSSLTSLTSLEGAPTPFSSPSREMGGTRPKVKTQGKSQEKAAEMPPPSTKKSRRQKEKRDRKPTLEEAEELEIRIVAPKRTKLPPMSNEEIAKELQKGTRLKYATNSKTALDVSEFIFAGAMDLTKYNVSFVDKEVFDKLRNGQYFPKEN